MSALERYEESAAHYERIYVMYTHYNTWTAKAYVRKAEALIKAHQREKAIAVLKEMMTLSQLKDLSEFATGRELLERLEGSS